MVNRQTPSWASTVYGEVDAAIALVVGELQQNNREAWQELQQVAGTTLVLATLDAIQRHNASVLSARDPESWKLARQWEETYRTQAVQAHGYIEPPDFDRKRKVPIEDLYVAPQILSGRSTEQDEQLSIADFWSRIDRTVLLGDPGGGKSTAATYLAHGASKDATKPVPFFVVLRDFAKDGTEDRSFIEHIASKCSAYYQVPPPDGVIENLLLSGRALVVFDGLDELIDPSRRRELTDKVELFSSRFPLAKILVTSRRVGYEQAQLNPTVFSSYVLSGFTDEDVEEYVRRWFTTVEDDETRDVEPAIRAFIEESAAVPDLTATPLMLSLMCILYRGQGFIPRNRPEVYERCALLLFDKWDSSRQIFVSLKAAEFIDPAMKHLAYWIMAEQSGEEAVPESALVEETSTFLQDAFESEAESKRAAQQFIDFCRGRAWVLSEAGTTAEGEPLFKFTHRTFMEFFAAHELTRRADSPEDLGRMLLPRIASEQWDVVGQLAAQIANKNWVNGAERLFRRLLADRRRRTPENRDNILGFIWRCLGFIRVSPAFTREMVRNALDSAHVLSQRGGLFGKGALSLSAIGNVLPEARGWASGELEEQLLQMLSDPDKYSLATSVIVNWSLYISGLFAGSSVTPAYREEWMKWQGRLFEKNRAVILAESDRCRFAWKFGLLSDKVSVEEFVKVSRQWMQRPLSALFEQSTEAIIGVGMLSWVDQVLRRALTRGVEGDEENAVWLGSRLAAVSDVMVCDSTPVVGRENGDIRAPSWSVLRRVSAAPSSEMAAKARWGLLVLVMIGVELTDERAFNTRYSIGGEQDVLSAVVRSRSGEAVDEAVFVNTLFDKEQVPEPAFVERWLTGRVALVS